MIINKLRRVHEFSLLNEAVEYKEGQFKFSPPATCLPGKREIEAFSRAELRLFLIPISPPPKGILPCQRVFNSAEYIGFYRRFSVVLVLCVFRLQLSNKLTQQKLKNNKKTRLISHVHRTNAYGLWAKRGCCFNIALCSKYSQFILL